MKRIAILLLGLALTAAACNKATTSQTSTLSQKAANEAPQGQSFAMSEVQTANSAAKCWTVINGSVYDLTTYLPKHPGGPKRILPICGKDGTAAFQAQHGRQSKPNNTLENYKIGVLAK